MMHIVKTSDCILSPFGLGTQACWQAIMRGESALRHYSNLWDMPFEVEAGLITDAGLGYVAEERCAASEPTRFERMCITVAQQALADSSIDIASERVGIVLSTTKGDIALLAGGEYRPPSQAALRIAERLGNPNIPVVVCCACISGGQAQLLAVRMLRSGEYDHVLIIGADELNPFVVSGFQSLKSLSGVPCRPFDIDRTGLNLGEAAAAMILSATDSLSPGQWELIAGASRNDAVHISNPSKTAEGAWRAVEACLQEAQEYCGEDIRQQLAFINPHGTATMYNDEMEATAIHRAWLSHIPAVGFKGYFGHTMGAAGVIETILSCQATQHNLLPATLGYEEQGTSRALNLSSNHRELKGNAFLKMLSGFGGCNIALLWKMDEDNRQRTTDARKCGNHYNEDESQNENEDENENNEQQTTVHISGNSQQLTEQYHALKMEYPKFHKMDVLSKVGILASEMLLRKMNAEGTKLNPEELAEHTALVLCGSTGSEWADRKFQATISNPADFYPSPAVFVYTLPNIAAGEIALRHGIHGQTAYYMLPAFDSKRIARILKSSFLDSGIHYLIGGWVEANENNYTATLLAVNSQAEIDTLTDKLEKLWKL